MILIIISAFFVPVDIDINRRGRSTYSYDPSGVLPGANVHHYSRISWTTQELLYKPGCAGVDGKLSVNRTILVQTLTTVSRVHSARCRKPWWVQDDRSVPVTKLRASLKASKGGSNLDQWP